MTKYPAQIDTITELPTIVDNTTPLRAITINRLRDAIFAIETELGVKPRGSSSTVKARLDTIDSTLSIDFIEINGDLGGTASSPKIIGIRGNPISTVSPTIGDVLVWSGIAWVPESASDASTFLAAGDLDGYPYTQTVIGLRDNPITNIDPLDGYSLVFSDGYWVPSYLILDDGYLQGGFKVVADITGRNAIPSVRRKDGMITYVATTEEYYALHNGITNSDWISPKFKSYNKTVTNTSINYQVLYNDTVIAVDTSLAVIVTLPATPQTGHEIFVKDVTGGAAGANITINPGAELIDNSAGNQTISSNFGSMHFIYTGAGWSIF